MRVQTAEFRGNIGVEALRYAVLRANGDGKVLGFCW